MKRTVVLQDGHGRSHTVTLANYVTIWNTVKHMASIDPNSRVDGRTAGVWLHELRKGVHARINEGIPAMLRGLLVLDPLSVEPHEVKRGDVLWRQWGEDDVSRVRWRRDDSNGGTWWYQRRGAGPHSSWSKTPDPALVIGTWDTSTGVRTLRRKLRPHEHEWGALERGRKTYDNPRLGTYEFADVRRCTVPGCNAMQRSNVHANNWSGD